MAVTLSLFAGVGAQLFDNNGVPLSGGKIYTYAAGTTTPIETYTSNSGNTAHTNPIILDSAGRVPGGEIWLSIGVGYKFVTRTSTDVLIATYDNIPSAAQPPAANDADSIMYEQGYTVTAGSFIVGKIYRIVSIGTTNFTLIGASSNTVGLHFIATGVGSGNGTAELSQTVETVLQNYVSVKDFGTIGDGVADDTAAIQAALNSIPATGGMLYLPPGTYKTTSTLTLLGKSNVTVFGAGMGASVINASAVTGNLMVLGYNPGSSPPLPATLSNVTLRGFTLYGSATPAMEKIINYRGINNVVFDAMEFYNGYNEGVYCDGQIPAFDGLTFTNCYFHDCNKGNLSNGINTNTLGVTNIIIENNRFERMSTGLYVLGQNISISNNQFVDIRNIGIGVGESNLALTRSISGCVISGNNFVGLGKLTSGGFNHPVSIGINTNGASKIYADGTQDSGIIIANNTFKDSVSDTGHNVLGIKAGGNVKVIGNYASNLTVSNGISIFIQVSFSTEPFSYVGINTVPVKAYVENNTLETSPGGINWQYGMFVLSVDQASLFCSNNVMEGTLGGAQFYSTTNGFLPFVSLSGDQFSPTCRLYDLLGTDAALGTTSLALTGTNLTTFSTNVSRDVFPNLSTRVLVGATPDVSKGLYFFTNNAAPVSITDFLDTPDYLGKEITVYFNDANTTVVHNSSKIILAGAVNFTSSQGSSLTLYQPSVTTGAWYEKSRCKV